MNTAKKEVLDGTVGGALDPEDIENEDEAGTVAVPQPNDVINQAIMNAMNEIKTLVSERSAINAKITAVIEGLEAKGVNRHAFRYAMKVEGMDETQRSSLDLSYVLSRTAMDIPVQTDWIQE